MPNECERQARRWRQIAIAAGSVAVAATLALATVISRTLCPRLIDARLIDDRLIGTRQSDADRNGSPEARTGKGR